MNKILRFLLYFSFSLFITSCEEGVFSPRRPQCLETIQTQQNGLTINKEYSDSDITAIRYSNNGIPAYSYKFTYGNDGRITESQYINDANGNLGALYLITYNEKGKWAKSIVNHPNGTESTQTAAYDDLNQIKSHILASTNTSGASTVYATYDYTWEEGNNTRRTYTSSTQELVNEYTFDLTKENKRKKQQEKIAFFSPAIGYNKNMLKEIKSTNTTSSGTTVTTTNYNFQYNEEGYPVSVTLTTTSGSGATSTSTVNFSYDCY